MNNAEKYKEVFGFEPDMGNCPSNDCKTCPLHDCDYRPLKAAADWWDSEYEGAANLGEGESTSKPNCVDCDHFGKCDGCEKREEE